MSTLLTLFALASCLTLAGCGYRFGHASTIACYRTVSIPYVEGDHDGRLTGEIVRALNHHGTLRYCCDGGDLTLRVKLLDFREENIGFRYDRNKTDDRIGNVIPTETRITALAEVTVIENCSCCQILGPDLVTASVDYDHDYYSNHGGVNVFSLGQLNDIDLAQQVAYLPISRALARRVVEHIVNSW